MAAIDFPANPTPGQQFTAAGVTWTYDGTKWTALGNNLGIPDAPVDGNTYGRKNLSWVNVAAAGGSVPEAPNDGTSYARKNTTWQHITHSDITDWAATLAPYALITSLPPAGSSLPVVNGVAAAGTNLGYSRQDHVHPTDTSRYSVSNPAGYIGDAPNDTNGYLRKNNAWAVAPSGISEAPNDGWSYVRENLAWEIVPTFQSLFLGGTGLGAAPSFNTFVEGGFDSSWTVRWASSRPQYNYEFNEFNHTFSVNRKTNGTAVDVYHVDADATTFNFTIPTVLAADPTVALGAATKQYVDSKSVTASSTNPLMNGAVAIGASLTYARSDHVHPTDTTRAAATALANYLPLTGGSLSGATGLLVNSPGNITIGGTGQITAPYWSTGGHKFNLGWNNPALAIGIDGATAGNLLISKSQGAPYTVPADTIAISSAGNTAGIWTGGSGFTWSVAASDVRLKSAIESATGDALAAINGIEVYEFDLTMPGATASRHWNWGIMANEALEAAVPSSYEPAAETDAGTIYAMAHDLPLIAALIKAVQQLTARLEALEAARDSRE